MVITDGEPTAHFEDGQVEFSYPPTRRTIQETLREVQRCTKDGITINTFMLERSRALAEFVAHMTRLNRGRAFYATPSTSANTSWSTSSAAGHGGRLIGGPDTLPADRPDADLRGTLDLRSRATLGRSWTGAGRRAAREGSRCFSCSCSST